MKRMISILLALTVCCALILSVSAAKPSVIDGADVLDAAQETALNKKIDKLSKNEDFDIVILTVLGIGNTDIQEYGEDYYTAGDYSEDGIILVAVTSGTPRYGYVAFGNGNDIFDDDAMDELDSAFVSTLKKGNFDDAFHAFVDIVTQTVEDYSPISMTTIIIAIAIGALLAWLIPMSVMKGDLKSVRRQAAAESYVRPGSMILTQERDLFLYRNVVRVAKPKATSSSGGARRTSGGNRGRSG